ncbi:MAG: hypothetical protein EOO77_08520 [Oxalobacteraceae bacterium]|nr:MAG: hypothetical protein EOO77_08520 [Oxalobacteraceae bacterium]
MVSFGTQDVSAFESGRQHGVSVRSWAGDCPNDREAEAADHRDRFDGFSVGRSQAGLIPCAGVYGVRR